MFLTPQVGLGCMIAAVIMCGIVYGCSVGQQIVDDDHVTLKWPRTSIVAGLLTLYFAGALIYEPAWTTAAVYTSAQEYTAMVLMLGAIAAFVAILFCALIASTLKDWFRGVVMQFRDFLDGSSEKKSS